MNFSSFPAQCRSSGYSVVPWGKGRRDPAQRRPVALAVIVQIQWFSHGGGGGPAAQTPSILGTYTKIPGASPACDGCMYPRSWQGFQSFLFILLRLNFLTGGVSRAPVQTSLTPRCCSFCLRRRKKYLLLPYIDPFYILSAVLISVNFGTL